MHRIGRRFVVPAVAELEGQLRVAGGEGATELRRERRIREPLEQDSGVEAVRNRVEATRLNVRLDVVKDLELRGWRADLHLVHGATEGAEGGLLECAVTPPAVVADRVVEVVGLRELAVRREDDDVECD